MDIKIRIKKESFETLSVLTKDFDSTAPKASVSENEISETRRAMKTKFCTSP